VTLPEMLGTPGVGSPPAIELGPLPSADPAARPGATIPEPAASAGPSWLVDRAGADARRQPTGGPVAVATAGGHAAGSLAAGRAVAPTRPDPGAASPPARDAAWARRNGTPATVAAVTVAILVLLLAGATVAGRRRGSQDGSA